MQKPGYPLKSISFFKPDNTSSTIWKILYFRYILFTIVAVFLYFFHTRLPFPYPGFFLVTIVFFFVTLIIHLFQKILKKPDSGYIALIYADALAAPFVFQWTGGFISPFIAFLFFTGIVICQIFPNYKKILLFPALFMLLSYLAVAIGQKSDLLPNPVEYSHSLMANTLFFVFIILINSILVISTIAIVENFQRQTRRLLDDASNAFDNIIKGISPVAGEDFFKHLAQSLAQTLNAQSVVVFELVHNKEIVRPLAMWKENTLFIDDFDSPVAGSILEKMLIDKKILYTGSLDSRFMPFSKLTHGQTRLFLFGFTLYSAMNTPTGFICVLNETPLDSMHLFEPVVRIFASRAQAELERKHVFEQQIELEAKLAHAQKMEAIGHLASGIAHDFNNIFFAIAGYANLLSSKLTDDSIKQKYVKPIADSGLRASELIKRLLTFARGSKSLPVVIDIHKTIAETILAVERNIDSRITVVTVLTSKTPFTMGDADLIKNVIINLSINAIEAMEKNGGTLTFSTNTTNLEESGLLCKTFKIPPGTYLSVSVADTGKGMSNEVIKHIFEPFFTTKSKTKGAGLGLANVWGYVENYSGALEVHSNLGKGSIFSLYLPVIDPATLSNPDEIIKPLYKRPEKINKTVLVVDDEPSVREIIKEILHLNGYKVLTAENGEEGLRILSQKSDQIDLMVLDLIMPKKTGVETFRELRKTMPNFKVIFISGFGEEKELQELLNDPETSFIQKPFTSDRFILEVNDMLFLE